MNDALAFKLSKIPHAPGVYLWKNVANEIIYIGKAIDLFKRTHQYFLKHEDGKTNLLVNEINDVDFIVVNNENESLILEANLIRKHQPKYNILLKNSNSYPYIVLTNETHPRLLYTNDLKTNKGYYFGPFVNNKIDAYGLFKLLTRILPFRKCKTIPKQKCLYYDMQQCLGPCIKHIEPSEYVKYIEQIHGFFSGNIKDIVKQLEKSEQMLSDNMNFEEAQKTHETVNDLIQTAKILKESQLVFLKSKQTIDVVGYVISNHTICITIFSYIDGKLLMKNNQISDLYGNGEEEILSYLFQYYDNNKNLPDNVYISLPNKLLKQLSNQLGINFINPITGKYKTIIKNAMENARKSLTSNYLAYKNKFNRTMKAYDEFKILIGNPKLSLIHVFDISNLFNENKVGSMIVVDKGNFNKSLYKKFIIKDTNLSSDTQCMMEVIKRQYSRAMNENKKLPDLIIVDGGKPQVSACKQALQQCNLNIQVMGLAKNNKHLTDKIVFDNGNEYKIPLNSNIYMFLLNAQEEVHRFAISFFKQKKIKQLFNSQLDNIPGVGQKTIKKLLDFYGSIDNIKKANISEIAQLVDKKTAKLIKATLK